MEFLVLIKQTPVVTQMSVDPESKTLVRDGVPAMMNPADKNALEAALQLKEQEGGRVTALTMGPAEAQAVLREALSLGADAVCLVSDEAFAGSDTLATAEVLAAAIHKLGAFDLILAGAQSIDGYTGQVGPKVAAMLGIGALTYAKELRLAGDTLTVKRDNHPFTETWETILPALCTVTVEANSPRNPVLKNKMAASKAEIPTLTNADLGIPPEKIGQAGSLSRVTRVFVPEKGAIGAKLTDARELAQTLLDQTLI